MPRRFAPHIFCLSLQGEETSRQLQYCLQFMQNLQTHPLRLKSLVQSGIISLLNDFGFPIFKKQNKIST